MTDKPEMPKEVWEEVKRVEDRAGVIATFLLQHFSEPKPEKMTVSNITGGYGLDEFTQRQLGAEIARYGIEQRIEALEWAKDRFVVAGKSWQIVKEEISRLKAMVTK